ncbi:A-adding tRNA nucleotidyltransferase [Geotalea sp. SG265]|uniref:A-adding tRNA nucleotidyltransferase n=1 Tax=Geotalea sp. SG265 TaxID=2922867 RepID=UPI001FAE79E4|nr:A-adding tRNA nucleotidyltransferase [Geotalea sp. SG265]
MEVITTHVNADFDCLGAMVAAKILYPDALMVFSGAQEKSMRDFFLKSTGYALNFTRLKDVDLTAITRLIIVDCQHSSRIGRFAEILHRPGLEIHIYDHHPESSGDIVPTGGVIRASGSSTTILTSLLREQGVEVNPTEATLMMLGIYEDTGSLIFPSTTTEDFHAAAWLLEHGASLNTVADFITQELTAEQVSLLNDLLKSLKTTELHGVEISIAQASVDYYIGDIAVLAHMMRDMENLEALFVVVGMASRVYIVARSRISEVNVSEILQEFGGGGHASAASAAVKDLTVIQVLEKLEKVLRARVNPRRTAGDIMSSPVKTIDAGATMEEAREMLTRYNVNALPVVKDGRLAGIISRRIVEKSLYHNLGQVPVTDYMHSEFMTATPGTGIKEIQDYMIGRNRRLVPVLDDGRLAGVVTRTDILRYMHNGEDLYDLARAPVPMKSKEMRGLMGRTLTPRILQILHDLGTVGDSLDVPVYAVGGFVRDLLMYVPNLDVDVTVEGDGILFAETFAGRFGCRVKSHDKFGTAVIVFPDGFKIDVASTRLEYYVSPGALPTVERSSLKMDLYRRDFTINTLAIRLNESHFGVMLDFFGAQRDLQDRLIRVLHNLSFVEDPTRVFRAIRFEQRLNFTIAKHTENLIKNAVKMDFLEKLGGKRLLAELVHILREKEPIKAIERMASFGLLRFIHPVLELTSRTRILLEESRRILTWFDLLFLDRSYERWAVYFLVLCESLTHDQLWGTCTRLSVSEHYREKLFETRSQGEEALAAMEKKAVRNGTMANSEVFFLLKDLPVEVLLYLMSKTGSDEVKKWLSLYFTKLQNIRCFITGHDLRRLHVPPGPVYRELLDLVLKARLDGKVTSRKEELELVRHKLKKM